MQILGIKETSSIMKFFLMLMNVGWPSAAAKICMETMIKDLNFCSQWKIVGNGKWWRNGGLWCKNIDEIAA